MRITLKNYLKRGLYILLSATTITSAYAGTGFYINNNTSSNLDVSWAFTNVGCDSAAQTTPVPANSIKNITVSNPQSDDIAFCYLKQCGATTDSFKKYCATNSNGTLKIDSTGCTCAPIVGST